MSKKRARLPLPSEVAEMRADGVDLSFQRLELATICERLHRRVTADRMDEVERVMRAVRGAPIDGPPLAPADCGAFFPTTHSRTAT